MEDAQASGLVQDLRGFIADGRLTSKVGTNGPMRDVVYVSKHQCATLREELGFSEEQAARRVGVTIARLRQLLEGVNWRKAEGIPLATVQAMIKRLQSREGYTVGEAAKELGESVQWVLDRRQDGTIKVSRAKWDQRRVYISRPMLKRLQEAKNKPVSQARFDQNWLLLSEAAHEAGVTSTTLIRWANDGELERQKSKLGWRYHRDAVRARARTHWASVRFIRATPPSWVLALPA